MTTPQDPGSNLVANLETLGKADCWALLATAQVGRLGLVVDGRPEVLPVNYALDGERVLYRTAEGTVLNKAAMSVVAFQVDHIDEITHAGWSVMVQGVALDIGDAIDQISERLRRLSLITWAPGSRPRWYRIDADKVTGRRLRVTPDAL